MTSICIKVNIIIITNRQQRWESTIPLTYYIRFEDNSSSNQFLPRTSTNFEVILRYNYDRWYIMSSTKISSINTLNDSIYAISLTSVVSKYGAKKSGRHDWEIASDGSGYGNQDCRSKMTNLGINNTKEDTIFGSCYSQNFYLFSWKEEEKEKGRKRKKREKREKKEGKDWYIEDYNSILLFGWCGPMTLKLFVQTGGFVRVCTFEHRFM